MLCSFPNTSRVVLLLHGAEWKACPNKGQSPVSRSESANAQIPEGHFHSCTSSGVGAGMEGIRLLAPLMSLSGSQGTS